MPLAPVLARRRRRGSLLLPKRLQLDRLVHRGHGTQPLCPVGPQQDERVGRVLLAEGVGPVRGLEDGRVVGGFEGEAFGTCAAPVSFGCGARMVGVSRRDEGKGTTYRGASGEERRDSRSGGSSRRR